MNKFGILLSDNLSGSEDENIKALADAGFEYTFIKWDENIDIKSKMDSFSKYGIKVESFHAPFCGINCIWKNECDGDKYVEKLKKCIKDAAMFKVEYVTVHAADSTYEPKTSAIGIKRFRELAIFANDNKVKICFENTEYVEILGIVLNELSDLNVGFTYDVGHEATCTPGFRLLPMFADKLCCTHIHDNYGMSSSVTPTYHGDCHMLPLDASIDFKSVMKRIRDAKFNGVLMIESYAREDLDTYVGMDPNEYYKTAYERLTLLGQMC